MQTLPAKFASAIFATLIASAALAIFPQGDAVAADDCLAAPNEQTPVGSHWHYRIDHATDRHCWYLREAGERASQIAPPTAAMPAKPIAPKAQAATPPPPENARAELPPQTRIGRTNPKDEPNPALPANAADIPRAADTADASAPLSSVVAPRWLDPTALSSAVSTQPAAKDPDADAQPDAAAAPPSAPAAAPPSAPAAVPLVAAFSSARGQPRSIGMLLSVIAGALVFAGITARLVFIFGRVRWSRRRRVRLGRGPVRKTTDKGRVVRSARPQANVMPRRRAIPRDLDRPEDPGEGIEELLSQLSRRAAS